MPTTTPVTLHSSGGFRTEVQAGPHRFVLDEPAGLGGAGEGPTPYDLLAAALGGCTAMTLHFYARREGMPLEAVDVRVEHDRQHAKDCAECLTQSGFIHQFQVDIRLTGDLTDAQRAKLLEVAGRCPVRKTLEREIRVSERLVD